MLVMQLVRLLAASSRVSAFQQPRHLPGGCTGRALATPRRAVPEQQGRVYHSFHKDSPSHAKSGPPGLVGIMEPLFFVIRSLWGWSFGANLVCGVVGRLWTSASLEVGIWVCFQSPELASITRPAKGRGSIGELMDPMPWSAAFQPSGQPPSCCCKAAGGVRSFSGVRFRGSWTEMG